MASMSSPTLNGASFRNHSAGLAFRPEFPALPSLHVFTKPADLASVDSEELIREILRRIGDDPDREGLKETPARIVRSWKELYRGYDEQPQEVLRTQFQTE